MYLDDNLVLVDNESIKATGAGKEIALTSLRTPGRAEPIPFSMVVTEDVAGASAVAFKLQQADAKGGTYADVPGGGWTATAAEMKAGYVPSLRFLPVGVNKPWIKLTWTVTGTGTAGKVFAALTREENMPYTDELKLNHLSNNA